MEILLENEDKLQLSWHPGCFFGGSKYILGEVGRRGPGVTEDDLKKPWICKGLPSSLSFHIRFKNTEDIDLYNKIKNIIVDVKNTDLIIDVKTSYPPLRRDRLELKDGYQGQFDIITNLNDLLEEKYLSLLKQLKELGCDCDDIGGPIYKKIHDYWYNWGEHHDATQASIDICCHDKTQCYLFLKDNGILDKYFPEWYKLGNF